jgi:hypothetical protein
MAPIEFKKLQAALAGPLGVDAEQIQEEVVIGEICARGSAAREAIVAMMGGYFEEHASEVDMLLGGILSGRNTRQMTGAELLDAANRLYDSLNV